MPDSGNGTASKTDPTKPGATDTTPTVDSTPTTGTLLDTGATAQEETSNLTEDPSVDDPTKK